MSTIALTGHTRGLGAKIHSTLQQRNHVVHGFSLSTGCDLRNYDHVTSMIKHVKDFDWFINCAHPDYCQTQILYRLIDNDFQGTVLNIGSPVVHRTPDWTDIKLLEYVTQKTALHHAYKTLNKMFGDRILMWEPDHACDIDYVSAYLEKMGL